MYETFESDNLTLDPDEMLCDCGHPRKLHKMSLKKNYICLYQDPQSGEYCPCYAFTITLKNLPGRLTEADIVNEMRSQGDKGRFVK